MTSIVGQTSYEFETTIEAMRLVVSVLETTMEALGPMLVLENAVEALVPASGLETALEAMGLVSVLEIVNVLAMEMRHNDDHVGKELD
jgi:hypothetical protein